MDLLTFKQSPYIQYQKKMYYTIQFPKLLVSQFYKCIDIRSKKIQKQQGKA